MRRLLCIILAIAVLSCAGMLNAATKATQYVSEGTVTAVLDWALYIVMKDGTPLKFSPYYSRSIPQAPAFTVFPALEPGETVRVVWSMDKKGVRRVDAISVTSSLAGVSYATVTGKSNDRLTVTTLDKPGSTGYDYTYVKIATKTVVDPVLAAQLKIVKSGYKVTINWKWDAVAGCKRITSIKVGW